MQEHWTEVMLHLVLGFETPSRRKKEVLKLDISLWSPLLPHVC